MRKAHLLSLAIAMASSTAYAVEQGEFVYHGFGTVGITHMGGEDDYDYGIDEDDDLDYDTEEEQEEQH